MLGQLPRRSAFTKGGLKGTFNPFLRRISQKFTRKLDISSPAAVRPAFRLLQPDGSLEGECPIEQPQLLKMYRDMLLTKVLDTILYDAQRQGRLSFYMVSAGEEGTSVGSAAALGPNDQIFCQYREQGALIYRGMTLDNVMDQVFYTHNDEGKGRMMPVHYTLKGINLHPISSPLTSQLPHAAGAAYALKLEGTKAVSVCYFGEGAASEGDFHAALNIAATRECPVLYVCRNNGYAISTPAAHQYRGDGIVSRAAGYGIPSVRVDGNDVLAVYEATRQARDLALRDSTPILLECMSYRVAHHSTSDDSFAYRKRAEVDKWVRHDNPISRLRNYLERVGAWDEDLERTELESCRKRVLNRLADAEAKPKPPLRELFSDVWSVAPAHLREQERELEALMAKYPEHYRQG